MSCYSRSLINPGADEMLVMSHPNKIIHSHTKIYTRHTQNWRIKKYHLKNTLTHAAYPPTDAAIDWRLQVVNYRGPSGCSSLYRLHLEHEEKAERPRERTAGGKRLKEKLTCHISIWFLVNQRFKNNKKCPPKVSKMHSDVFRFLFVWSTDQHLFRKRGIRWRKRGRE